MPLSLPQPEEVFQAAQSAETELRQQYLSLDPSIPPTSGDQEQQQLIERSAALLELVAGSVCFIEALREEGAPSISTLSAASHTHFRSRVKQLCGLDLDDLLPRAIRTLDLPIPTRGHQSPPSPAAILRAVRSFLEACPIEYLELAGRTAGLVDAAHRCRTAYDALRSYAVRNDPATGIQIRLIGRGYSQGVHSAEDAATLLKVPIPDALKLLEDHGHQRPLDVISLTVAEREEKLRSIRADRLARQGRAEFSLDLLARDVLASERIENVDARNWLPKGGM